MITSKKLKKFKNIKHYFFNKNGGYSTGIYKSLNCGQGSKDKKKNVIKNINAVCKKINSLRKNIFLLNQIHSNKFIFIDKNFKFKKKKIKADAIITNLKKLPIGVLTADCVPILIYEKELKIIAAIHAGWRGAYKDIIYKVLSFIKRLGSQNKNIYVAIGPCITGKNYEVQKDFKQKFIKKNKKNSLFFKKNKNKTYFCLNNYIYNQFKESGIKNIELIKKDTFDKKNNFFSARRSHKNNEHDYGRNISIIMIK